MDKMKDYIQTYYLLIRGNIGAQVVVRYQGETQSYIDYWVMQRQLKEPP